MRKMLMVGAIIFTGITAIWYFILGLTPMVFENTLIKIESAAMLGSVTFAIGLILFANYLERGIGLRKSRTTFEAFTLDNDEEKNELTENILRNKIDDRIKESGNDPYLFRYQNKIQSIHIACHKNKTKAYLITEDKNDRKKNCVEITCDNSEYKKIKKIRRGSLVTRIKNVKDYEYDKNSRTFEVTAKGKGLIEINL